MNPRALTVREWGLEFRTERAKVSTMEMARRRESILGLAKANGETSVIAEINDGRRMARISHRAWAAVQTSQPVPANRAIRGSWGPGAPAGRASGAKLPR